ncbi:hypothetical protein ONZ45_g16193 [Pleurotus djamor]|nr:hypothetical protein ONZ45_g16193 [Pleurotus djamor]
MLSLTTSTLGPTSYLFLTALTLLAGHRILNSPSRPKTLPKTDERVVILGASSGIGKAIAEEYVRRGARVCIVGRRADQLKEVDEALRAGSGRNRAVLSQCADFTSPEELVRVRQLVQNEWGGFDTLIVAAGVSALQPLMTLAGVKDRTTDATAEGIAQTVEIAGKAISGNYYGPMASAIAFIPMLTRTSLSPSILLISSLASVVPAPTRTIYASTKAASLVLYQALSIEHPQIAFSAIMPYTVEGDFRASAVDAGPVREADPSKHGLKREAVAARCIEAIDRGEKTVFQPAFYRAGFFLYWIWPAFVEWRARKKYNFTS